MTSIYEISVETSFAASHQLRGYKEADLEPLHGHNFRVEAFVSVASLPGTGLVMDFLELRRRLPAEVTLRRVRVWEAPTYSASYGEP
jgi:6-pyruvoyl-tetrahydropterin synthase